MNDRSCQVVALLVLLAVFSVGCGGSQKKSTVVGKPLQVEGLDTLDPTVLLDTYGKVLPADTVAVATVDMAYFLDELLTDGLGMLPEGWDSSAMDSDLSALSVKHLGVDMTQAETMLMAVTEDKEVVVILGGDFGEPEGVEPFNHPSLKVFKAPGNVLLVDLGVARSVAMVFDPDHLAALAQVKAEGKGLASTESMERLKRVMATAGNGVTVVGVALGDGEISKALREGLKELDELTLEGASLSISDRVGLAVQADPLVLGAIQLKFGKVMGEFKAELEEQMKGLDDRGFFDGVMTVVAYHTVSELSEALKPTVEGDMLSLHVGMPSTDALLPVAMTFAVASVPAMVLEQGAVKVDPSIEARGHMRRMAEGATWFYENQSQYLDAPPDTTGAEASAEEFVPRRRFPVSTPASPGPSCCHERGGNDANQNNLCDVDFNAWTQGGWSELFFVPDQEHRYVYELINNGEYDKKAALTIRAMGDADCDGVMETLEVKLSVDDQGKVNVGKIEVTANAGE